MDVIKEAFLEFDLNTRKILKMGVLIGLGLM